MIERSRIPLLFACATALLLAAGCGGGGGGGSSPPTTSPTVRPSTTPTAAPTVASNPCGPASQSGVNQPCSTYAVQSNPSGLTVLLNGTAVATTPASVVPNPAYNNTLGASVPSQITIQSGSSQPAFTVTFNQLRDGAQQVYYNRVVDTQGSIATNYQSVVRAQSLPQTNLGPVARRTVATNLKSRPSVDAQHLFVKYQLSALAMGGRNGSDIESAEGLSGGHDVITTDGYLTRVVPIPNGQTYDGLASRLRSHAEVAKVDHVYLRYPLASSVTPNDPYLTQMNNAQWDMFQIGMPTAWGYTLGTGITIASLDTGYDNTSQDFSKVTQAYSFTNGNGTGPSSGAPDTDGHGSNTAGIAGAVTNNGFGFAGTSYNAGLMILKIIANNGSISTADEAAALQYAANNGARVVSLSLGGSQIDGSGDNGYDDTEFAGISYALSHNVVVVAAAGNEGTPYTPATPPVCNSSLPACGTTNLDYPGAYPGVIAVGASACIDNGSACTSEYVASYSNGGPGLALVAPGGDPSSNTDNDNFHWIYNLSTTMNPQFPCNASAHGGVCGGQFAGTSQATPHVAGAAALLLAVNPGLTPAQVAQLLESTTDYLPGIDPSYQGAGRLNVARALAKLEGDASFPTYRPAPNQFVAFAYTNSGAVSAAPAIIDIFYARGAPVSSAGTFRIADINPSGAYKIGVWYDANGDGIVDAGDYFGSSGPCSTSAPCSATNISVAPLGTNVMP